jgi:stress-induced morphogen
MSGPVTQNELTQVLTAELKAENVMATDESDGCGAKWLLEVSSPQFEGVSKVNRQRMVNAVLKDLLPRIHALTFKLWTPGQWAAKH